MSGCSIRDGLYQSTLQCFFDASCADRLDRLVNVRSPRLNSSSTQYFPNISIGENILEQVKTVRSTVSNYSAYFQLCSPSYCQYSYVKQNDVAYVFTALLGLYGGLTAALRIIVWHGLQTCFLISHKISSISERFSSWRLMRVRPAQSG
jgi:hypothetical protein